MDHLLTLTYYTSDDGVWLECQTCDHQENLGFNATARHAMLATEHHQATVRATK